MSVAKVKKGSSVIMCGFTGMKLGVYQVTAADKDTITIEKADGTEVEFSRKTGKQLKAKNPKYANSIMEDDGSYVDPRANVKASAKKAAKKPAKKVKEEEIEEEIDDEEDEEEEEAPKKKSSKKAKETTKKSTKKASKKKVEEDEDEDEDEDDFEEVE